MGIFAQQFGHCFYHGMFDKIFCGWNSVGYWNPMPMFFTPNYLQGTFMQYPSVFSFTPQFNNIPVPNFINTTPSWDSINTYQSWDIKPTVNPVSASSETTKVSNNSNVGDTITASKRPATTETKKTSPSANPKRHWSDMDDSELKAIYGNYTRDITHLYKGDEKKLNKFLSDKGVLAGKGKVFMDAQKKYGISAVVLIAICAHESGNGKSNLAKTKNNVGGIRLKGSTEFRSFSSVEACIEEMARLLKDNYVNNSGRSLRQLYQINAKYCPASDTTDKTGGNSAWAQRVERIARQVESISA